MISIAIGIGIGWFIQEFFVTLLKDYFPTNLPKAGINPLIISALTVIICLTGFCLPYLVKLANNWRGNNYYAIFCIQNMIIFFLTLKIL